MITHLFKGVAYGYLSTRRQAQNLVKMGAEALCPAECAQQLGDCYKAAATIRTQILHLTARPNLETAFLADFFEVKGGDDLKTYSALMACWGGRIRPSPQTTLHV